ncbi:L-2-amino-thiazoline-4-carboxylic acid hydrolase [Clostridium sp. AM58-1XD]|uniref:L-2-amino-thiazoline-4-carboxylic acid hydrolase n=1 Tax=Clostridium sp. AM58-1XD TaxID=2292307 RepID=UPI000E525DC0|nr:L-2-amino-thiazoline-4-carboxylic acid hydrolase [Clostridium sp. AM58-1XD]RGY99081.1 hypothetical protein DXA13_09160 [Clostridium sp. AM58-1XD]
MENTMSNIMNDINSKHILFKSRYAVTYKRELESLLGINQSAEIIHTAVLIFDVLKERYPHLLKKEQFHTYTNIFPVIAFYKALTEHGIDSPMAILEKGAAEISCKKGKSYSKIVSMPGMKGIFLKMFSGGVKTLFGEAAGFRQEFLKNDRRSLEFNITQCPYQFYCEKEGCPELVHIFCQNDEYAYGHLPGITFIRIQTLGTGGELCDFKFRRTV